MTALRTFLGRRVDVWLKADFPEHYHYKNNRRVGDVLIMEKLSYAVYSTAEFSIPGYSEFKSQYFRCANRLKSIRGPRGAAVFKEKNYFLKILETTSRVVGNHGYSNVYPEMRPFFIAIGPVAILSDSTNLKNNNLN